MNQIPHLPNDHRQKTRQGLTPSKGIAPIRKDALTHSWKGRPPRQVWRLLRQAVFERDGRVCVYCGKAAAPLTCDHVLPVSRGGSSTMDNLVTACLACNTAKATRTPEEWRTQVRQGKQEV